MSVFSVKQSFVPAQIDSCILLIKGALSLLKTIGDYKG